MTRFAIATDQSQSPVPIHRDAREFTLGDVVHPVSLLNKENAEQLRARGIYPIRIVADAGAVPHGHLDLPDGQFHAIFHVDKGYNEHDEGHAESVERMLDSLAERDPAATDALNRLEDDGGSLAGGRKGDPARDSGGGEEANQRSPGAKGAASQGQDTSGDKPKGVSRETGGAKRSR